MVSYKKRSYHNNTGGEGDILGKHIRIKLYSHISRKRCYAVASLSGIGLEEGAVGGEYLSKTMHRHKTPKVGRT